MLSSQGPNLKNMCPPGLKVGYSCIFVTPTPPFPHTTHTHRPIPHPTPPPPTPTPTPTPLAQGQLLLHGKPALVCIPTSNVSQWINITSRHRKHNNRTGGTTQVVMLVAWKTSGRMQEIWNFQAELTSLFQGRISKGTKKTYEGTWKRGSSCCVRRSLTPVSVPVEDTCI